MKKYIMKTLCDYVSLEGKIETISIVNFRRRPGDVLLQVELGKTFVLTRNGKIVSVLSKPPGKTLRMVVGPKGEVTYAL